jgi:hypothetical protein
MATDIRYIIEVEHSIGWTAPIDKKKYNTIEEAIKGAYKNIKFLNKEFLSFEKGFEQSDFTLKFAELHCKLYLRILKIYSVMSWERISPKEIKEFNSFKGFKENFTFKDGIFYYKKQWWDPDTDYIEVYKDEIPRRKK